MTPKRCYTLRQVCDVLQLSRRTFYDQQAAGQLPFVEELRPRIGRRPRYRADLIDRYLENKFVGPRHLTSARGR
jgi:excisionase family DNA binding protein